MASHRRTPRPGPAARTTRVTVLSAAAAATAALSGGTAQLAAAEPAADPAVRLDRLYEQAERATQAYDAAQERAGQLRTDIGALQDRAALGQQRVNSLRTQLGLLAAAQYRDGAVDPTLALLLSDHPARYLAEAGQMDRFDARQDARFGQLKDAERGLEQQHSQATAKLAALRQVTAQLAQHKKAVQRALSAARALLLGLPPTRRADFRPEDYLRASRDGSLPPLADLPASSERAALAVAAAQRVLGAPYAWGATGPSSFDCSGLMQYAYRQAGVSLPRTSQEQMNAGQRVPLSAIRPGDLVIYRSDASHVAMYVGAGRVIHAPYPGARVRYDPVGMMPITAVTRP